MNKKRIVICLGLAFLLLSALVIAAEPSPTIDQNFVESYFAGTGEISRQNLAAANSMSPKDKDAFLKAFADKTKISAIDKIGDKIKEFDSQGNAVLTTGHKIPLKKIYEYSSSISSGNPNKYSYKFNGENFEANLPAITEVSLTAENNLVYKFRNGGKMVLSNGADYDPLSRRITGKNGQKFEWLGMNGEVVVGDTINLNLIYREGDDDLKNFPILKKEDGTIISSYHKVVSGVKVPERIKPGEIANGKFRVFEEGGKKYSVDSKGIVREIEDSSVSLASEKLTLSNAYVSKEGFGSAFLGKDMQVYFGGTLPKEINGNFIYIGELSNNKRDVIIRSKNGETYYKLDSDMGKLHLEGDVFVKNGEIILKSTNDRRILFLSQGPDAKFQYDIGELLNKNKPENKYEIKEGQRISDINGAITIDIAGLTRGRSSARSDAILRSPSFNQLTGNLNPGNKNSVAIAVARGLQRLELADDEKNIDFLTKEILKAREAFGERVLFGPNLEKAIGVFHSDPRFQQYGMRELFYNSGIPSDRITFTPSDRQKALNELATSTGDVTFLFNGHGAPNAMASGGGYITYKVLADALQKRNQAGYSLNNVNIISFACYQYNCLVNLQRELSRRGINDFPVMISQAQMGSQSTPEWHDTVRALNNKQRGDPAVYGRYFFGAELGRGAHADPALFVPVKLNVGGREQTISLEIS